MSTGFVFFRGLFDHRDMSLWFLSSRKKRVLAPALHSTTVLAAQLNLEIIGFYIFSVNSMYKENKFLYVFIFMVQ